MRLAKKWAAKQRVADAHEITEQIYDQHLVDNVSPPIYAAISAWPIICGCYMGIEQTLKLLLHLRDKNVGKTHDLYYLYKNLDESEKAEISDYYRVCRSLYDFDTGDIPVNTAEEFISYIGKGYEAWRYLLREDTPCIPKMHVG